MKRSHQPPFDLFGEIAVTLDDVTLWVESVARIDRTSPRAEYYVKHWNVIEKIRRAKTDGTFFRISAANDEDCHDNLIAKHCPREHGTRIYGMTAAID